MKFWRRLAFFSTAGLIAFFIFLYFHLGLNRDVEIREGSAGPFLLLYKSHRGAYHQIGPTITAVEKWAMEKNLPCPKTFGEYIDNPESLDQDRLRSHGGCIMEKTPPEPLPEDFLFREVAEKNYVIARFEGSPGAGPLIVYPAVRKYLEEHRLTVLEPVIEIYTVNGSTVVTEYLFEKR